jgi:hypothetical protein
MKAIHQLLVIDSFVAKIKTLFQLLLTMETTLRGYTQSVYE